MTRRDREASRLLAWYPRVWRERYGEDLLAYLDDHYDGRLALPVRWSLIVGGLRERSRFCGLSGDTVAPDERVKAGLLLVLAAWAAFVFAGAGFAKVSEHFDSVLPSGAGAHTVPDAAFAAVRWAASITGLVAIAGLLMAAASFKRLLSTGGWPAIRSHVLRASLASLVTAAVTIAMAVAAHQLPPARRNGGDLWYAALFVAWGGLVALTMTAWTVAALAAGWRLTLPRRLLLIEAALATAVTAGMALIVGATLVWWISVTGHEVSFEPADAARIAGLPGTPQMTGILVVMVSAAAAATFGAWRAVRSGIAFSAE